MTMTVFGTIRVRMLALVVLMCLAMLSMLLWSLQRSHERAHQELFDAYDPGFAALLLTQGLGTPLGGADITRVEAALRQLGGVNPAVDLYWVDLNGKVLASSTGRPAREFDSISRALIANPARTPKHPAFLGFDPQSEHAPRPVAIEPVDIGTTRGYLYIVLKDVSLLGRGTGIDVAWLLGCWAVLATLAGYLALRCISNPLTQLAQYVESLDATAPTHSVIGVVGPTAPTEIVRLGQGVAALATRIAVQVQALKVMDEERRTLFASISHDLRAPISSLSAYLQTIASKDHLGDEERKQMCRISLDETKLMLRLLDDLLDLAKLESPGMKTDREPFPLAEAVAVAQRRFEPVAAAKGIVLLVPSGLESSPPLDADPVMIERLLCNILQNAIEHTLPGGAVHLDVRLADKWAEVQVTDTGPGIPENQIGRVFDRFFRGDGGSQPTKGGMGLGLAIAKRIVELHGGEIRVQSPSGGGASFRFTLPLVSPVTRSVSFLPLPRLTATGLATI